MPGVSNKIKHKSRIVTSDTHRAINVERPPLPHKSLDQVYVPIKHEDRTPASLYRNTRGYLREHFIPSGRCGKSFIKSAFPFLFWLRKYEMAWLPNDIICGITVAIMQIPQGMAYALLARVPAIIGLYISFFPSLIYPLFGTSRHLSMGAIAVISLMTGNVVDRLNVKPLLAVIELNSSNGTLDGWTAKDFLADSSYAISIASTLAFAVGIIQLLLCVFHLGFVTTFLSDSFISGYTTGTAVLVFTSQVPDIFGLTLKRYAGPFNVVYTYIEIFGNLKNTNIATLIVSICSIIAIVMVKEVLDPFYKKHIKKIKVFRNIQIPIPIELLVIIVGTLFSYFLKLNNRYQVKIVGTIGRGFRTPQVPALSLLPSLIKDAIVISIVSFAICISLAKTYANKFKYSVDPNQELAAYGVCNIVGSFFSSYASAASLSRTSVYVNAGGRTQLASIVSSVCLLIIILRIGPLFESLPKACLASIIVVALKGLFLQTKDIRTIGRVTKLESLVWILTFVSTVILDVDYGLIVGIGVSAMVVLIRQFRPRSTILGQYERSETYRNSNDSTRVHEIPHVKIFRFESSVIYFNAEYFRESLLDAVGIDLKTGQKRINLPKYSKGSDLQFRHLTHVIIDCASINQLDYSGGKIFLQTLKELNDCQYTVYLCNLIYYNRDILEKLQMEKICKVTVTATIQNAVHRIQDEKTDESSQLLSCNREI